MDEQGAAAAPLPEASSIALPVQVHDGAATEERASVAMAATLDAWQASGTAAGLGERTAALPQAADPASGGPTAMTGAAGSGGVAP